MAGTIIKEIKAATDSGVKLSPAMRDRLILSALVELYEASSVQTQALERHIKESGDDMSKTLKEHDARIKKLEHHDLVQFAFDHPKLTLFLISVALLLITFGKPILQTFGVVTP